MRHERFIVAGLLLVCLAISLPGVAEIVELTIPGDDCSESCPSDSSEGKCSSDCADCGCCTRTVTAALLPSPDNGPLEGRESAVSAAWRRPPVPFSPGVYHPPRA